MPDLYYYKDGSVLDYLESTKTLHREDGPAIEGANGDKFWVFDGKLHRLDGPAVDPHKGKYWKLWYLDGVSYTETMFYDELKLIENLPLELKLIDNREWVRKLALKTT